MPAFFLLSERFEASNTTVQWTVACRRLEVGNKQILISLGNQNVTNLDTWITSYSIFKAVLFSGNIENPRIESVIERDIGIDKETIDTIRTVLASGKYADAQQILENVFGNEHTGI